MPYFLPYVLGEEPWPPRARQDREEPEHTYYPYYPYSPFPPRERLLYFEEDFD